MGRPSLLPAFKKARLDAARQEAKRLNKKLPQHVYAWATPSGRVHVRYEPPTGGKKVLLRAPISTPEFWEEYAAAVRGTPLATTNTVLAKRRATVAAAETWRWLCERYFESDAFRRYSERCRRVRRRVLERTWSQPLDSTNPAGLTFGEMPVPKFGYRAIRTLQQRFAQVEDVPDPMYPGDASKTREVPTTPEAGNSVVRFVRLVLEFAKEHHTKLVDGRNCARDVRLLPPSPEGHKTWGVEQCAMFEARFPSGTRARLIYELARLTGQRLSDLARLGANMIELDGQGRERLSFTQMKGRNSRRTTAYVPVFPELRQALEEAKAAGILGERTYIAKINREPFTEASLGNFFTSCCKEAGLSRYSMHGLRKTAVVNLVKAGCSDHEIMAITGHTTQKEIARYSRDFRRGQAGEGAHDKWTALRERGVSPAA